MSLVFCTIYCHLVGDHKKEIVCDVTATQLKLTFGVCLRQELLWYQLILQLIFTNVIKFYNVMLLYIR